MTIEYRKNGKAIELPAIYDSGREGQAVVFDHVSYGENPDLIRFPEAKYPRPTVFVIKQVLKEEPAGKVFGYELIDPKGNKIDCSNNRATDWWAYLYDANAWAAFRRDEAIEKNRRKDGQIDRLQSQIDLLKSILIQQGVKLITPEQAEVIKNLFGK